jgi:hypothetical protein
MTGARQPCSGTTSGVWIADWPRVRTEAAALQKVGGLLRRHQFRALGVRVFTTSIPLGVVLAMPY